MARSADLLARNAGRLPPRVGLVSPLPPQVGGVASVAEWLLAREDELGVRYHAFDLVRPDDEIGGRWSLRAAARQATVLGHFAAWLPGAPNVVHVCVSCTATGLPRDSLLVALVKLSGRRAVAHVHGPYDASLERPPGRFLLRGIGRLAEVTVAPSPTAARTLRSLGVAARWISNPIRATRSSARTNGSSPLRLLSVGRIGRGKGFLDLVEALAKARAEGVDATLVFVGGEMRIGDEEAVRRLVRSHGLDAVVDFVPSVSPDALAERYASAHVLCHPSEREGLPLAVLEGMSFGLPVLATRVGGVPDVVDDGRSGLLVEARDVNALAHGIRALADPALRRRLGAGARERVLQFTAGDRIAAQWSDVYGSLANGE
jgi:glycosyltransferase involved in cell wall biosynthesis